MKKKITIFDWISQNYILNVRDSQSMALKGTYRISRAKFLVALVILFIIFTCINYVIFNFLIGYSSRISKAEQKFKISVLSLSAKVDSLQVEIAKKDTFIVHLKKIITEK